LKTWSELQSKKLQALKMF